MFKWTQFYTRSSCNVGPEINCQVKLKIKTYSQERNTDSSLIPQVNLGADLSHMNC